MIPDDAAEDSSPPQQRRRVTMRVIPSYMIYSLQTGQEDCMWLGFFDYEIYAAANYIELGVSVLLFLFIFLFFLQRKIRYVHQLEEEVKIFRGRRNG